MFRTPRFLWRLRNLESAPSESKKSGTFVKLDGLASQTERRRKFNNQLISQVAFFRKSNECHCIGIIIMLLHIALYFIVLRAVFTGFIHPIRRLPKKNDETAV